MKKNRNNGSRVVSAKTAEDVDMEKLFADLRNVIGSVGQISDSEAVLQETLDQALKLTGGDRGTILGGDPGNLRPLATRKLKSKDLLLLLNNTFHTNVQNTIHEGKPLKGVKESNPIAGGHFIAVSAKVHKEMTVVIFLDHKPKSKRIFARAHIEAVKILLEQLRMALARTRLEKYTLEQADEIAMLREKLTLYSKSEETSLVFGQEDDSFSSLSDLLSQVTKETVERELKKHNGNRSHTARALGLSRTGLLKMIARYGL